MGLDQTNHAFIGFAGQAKQGGCCQSNFKREKIQNQATNSQITGKGRKYIKNFSLLLL